MGAYETAISECNDPESLRREVFRLRDELRAANEWQPIETVPDSIKQDGMPILVARHDPVWGWVRGFARWVDIRGVTGWVAHGFFNPPGELGLAHPTHWRPIPDPPKDAAAIRALKGAGS